MRLRLQDDSGPGAKPATMEEINWARIVHFYARDDSQESQSGYDHDGSPSGPSLTVEGFYAMIFDLESIKDHEGKEPQSSYCIHICREICSRPDCWGPDLVDIVDAEQLRLAAVSGAFDGFFSIDHFHQLMLLLSRRSSELLHETLEVPPINGSCYLEPSSSSETTLSYQQQNAQQLDSQLVPEEEYDDDVYLSPRMLPVHASKEVAGSRDSDDVVGSPGSTTVSTLISQTSTVDTDFETCEVCESSVPPKIFYGGARGRLSKSCQCSAACCLRCLEYFAAGKIRNMTRPTCPGLVSQLRDGRLVDTGCPQYLEKVTLGSRLFKDYCSLCMEPYSTADPTHEAVVAGECPLEHRFCRNCLKTQVRTSLSSGSSSQYSLPQCPRYAECRYNFDADSIRQLFETGPNSEVATSEVAAITSDERDEASKLVLKLHDNLRLQADDAHPLLKPCPVPDCPGKLERSTSESFSRCSRCHKPFCYDCRSTSHTGHTCIEADRVVRKWAAFLSVLAASDEQAGGNENKAAVAAAAASAIQRLQSNVATATYFQELISSGRFRLCPQCRRPIEHMGGCRLVTCGEDYHGGNKQQGCGFRISDFHALPAPTLEETGMAVVSPQKSGEVASGTAADFRQEVRDLLASVVWTAPHYNVLHWRVSQLPPIRLCTRCHKEVRGLRFDCLHCPRTSLCMTCVMAAVNTDASTGRASKHATHAFTVVLPRPLEPPRPGVSLAAIEISKETGQLEVLALSTAASQLQRPIPLIGMRRPTIVRVDVMPDGRVVYADNPGRASQWISLDSIQFKASNFGRKLPLQLADGVEESQAQREPCLVRCGEIVMGHGQTIFKRQPADWAPTNDVALRLFGSTVKLRSVLTGQYIALLSDHTLGVLDPSPFDNRTASEQAAARALMALKKLPQGLSLERQVFEYFDQVQTTFADNILIYSVFLDVLMSTQLPSVDMPAVMQQVRELFKGRRQITLGLNAFLPNDHQIDFGEDEDEAPGEDDDPVKAHLSLPRQAPATAAASVFGSAIPPTKSSWTSPRVPVSASQTRMLKAKPRPGVFGSVAVAGGTSSGLFGGSASSGLFGGPVTTAKALQTGSPFLIPSHGGSSVFGATFPAASSQPIKSFGINATAASAAGRPTLLCEEWVLERVLLEGSQLCRLKCSTTSAHATQLYAALDPQSGSEMIAHMSQLHAGRFMVELVEGHGDMVRIRCDSGAMLRVAPPNPSVAVTATIATTSRFRSVVATMEPNDNDGNSNDDEALVDDRFYVEIIGAGPGTFTKLPGRDLLASLMDPASQPNAVKQSALAAVVLGSIDDDDVGQPEDGHPPMLVHLSMLSMLAEDLTTEEATPHPQNNQQPDSDVSTALTPQMPLPQYATRGGDSMIFLHDWQPLHKEAVLGGGPASFAGMAPPVQTSFGGGLSSLFGITPQPVWNGVGDGKLVVTLPRGVRPAATVDFLALCRGTVAHAHSYSYCVCSLKLLASGELVLYHLLASAMDPPINAETGAGANRGPPQPSITSINEITAVCLDGLRFVADTSLSDSSATNITTKSGNIAPLEVGRYIRPAPQRNPATLSTRRHHVFLGGTVLRTKGVASVLAEGDNNDDDDGFDTANPADIEANTPRHRPAEPIASDVDLHPSGVSRGVWYPGDVIARISDPAARPGERLTFAALAGPPPALPPSPSWRG